MTSSLAIDALRNAVAKMPDDRLTSARHAALQRLHDHGTPSTRHEDWKYTDLAAIIDISNQWLAAGAQTNDSAADLIQAATKPIDAHWLIIENGAIDKNTVAALRAAGLQVSLLSDSEPAVTFDAPLADLNVALLRDGLRLRIDSDTVLEKPVGLLVADSAMSSVGVSQIRVEIEVAPNSRADIIEYHASSGTASHYANAVFEISVQDGGVVNYVRLQDRSLAHSQTGRLDVTLQRDSQFNHCGFDLGGQLVRNDLDIRICGPGSSANFNGLYLAGSGQHIDNHTKIHHEVGPAMSHQQYRGILTGSSRCIWNGKAIVYDGADGTDAQQANHNLLLSERAEVDAKPELEIYADDVKCSHGTTIGQLDDAAMFYLRTRGLDEYAARQLLTSAFAQSIVSMTPIPQLQEWIGARVAARLADLIVGDAE